MIGAPDPEDSSELKPLLLRLIEKPAVERNRFVSELTPEEAAELYYDWLAWSRPDQQPPEGEWVYWLILAGRGAGKTRAGAEAVRVWTRNYAIVNLIGATRHDAREIMITGESGVLAICPQDERPYYARASDRLEWPNGAVSQIFSAEEPDRLRGKQHMKLFKRRNTTLPAAPKIRVNPRIPALFAYTWLHNVSSPLIPKES